MIFKQLGRIRSRIFIVNVVVLLVPVAGLEFARIHERQLLDSLERDMANQAVMVRALLESDISYGVAPGTSQHQEILETAARNTRTRIRILDTAGEVLSDSHLNGPPEGPEPPPPSMLPTSRGVRGLSEIADDVRSLGEPTPQKWPNVPDRPEVKDALSGKRGAHTRIRGRAPGVFLFLSEPVRERGKIVGVVYVVRSTRPVIVELYRIRSGLIRVLAVAVFFTGLITLALAWSISRPLGKLSRAAKRVAAGERDVVVPIGGSGEIRELGESFAAMKERLDARLRYISDFAADVAHEFKSPLTSIRGAAELLEEGAADDLEARRRFLRNIELDVARLDRLVSRLLELSRIEASSEVMTIIDLEALAMRVVERAGTPDQPALLRYELQTRFLKARETDLETALMNLVENAVKFSPPGEPVVVTISGDEAGSRARIAVRDRGPGIPPQHLPKIFDRFFTTDADRDGTGLGLSIVRSVTQAHGGTITVDTKPGEGTTFLMEIPIRQS
jgi:two-component system sensor histidine kinase ChvG